jgi:hypothetical protein
MAKQTKDIRTAAVKSHGPAKHGVHHYLKRASAYDGRLQPWSVPDLCEAYDWPSEAPGRGVIALIELGGGWIQSDIETFFTDVGLPAPNITDVSVDGTKNSHCDPKHDADGQVALDIQVAGSAYAVATRRSANIQPCTLWCHRRTHLRAKLSTRSHGVYPTSRLIYPPSATSF